MKALRVLIRVVGTAVVGFAPFGGWVLWMRDNAVAGPYVTACSILWLFGAAAWAVLAVSVTVEQWR